MFIYSLILSKHLYSFIYNYIFNQFIYIDTCRRSGFMSEVSLHILVKSLASQILFKHKSMTSWFTLESNLQKHHSFKKSSEERKYYLQFMLVAYSIVIYSTEITEMHLLTLRDIIYTIICSLLLISI